MSKHRYYVEFAKDQGLSVGHYLCKDSYVYVYAYSEEHVRDIFGDYELVAVDQTDQEISMNKHWQKVKHYYLTHDGIEMFLFACIFGFFGWMAYHAVVGIIERVAG